MDDAPPLVPGKVFGTWDAPMTDDHEHITAPMGQTCILCRDLIDEGDNGRIAPVWLHQDQPMGGHIEHRECSFRQVMGGIGHLVNHQRYCRGKLGTDAGLSYRQSALLVWEFFHTTRLLPTPEETAQWEDRLTEARSDARHQHRQSRGEDHADD